MRCILFATAIVHQDYFGNLSNLTFSAGSADGNAVCAQVYIRDDQALERNQTFTVTVTSLDLAVITGRNLTIITIIDNDGELYLDNKGTVG